MSWFSLLARATTGVAAHGDHGHDGLGNERTGGGSAEGVASVDSAVPVIAVRRLVQSCGILQGTAGGPTLAHADMELQRNAVGKGGRSIGHREVRMRALLTLSSVFVSLAELSILAGSLINRSYVPFRHVLSPPSLTVGDVNLLLVALSAVFQGHHSLGAVPVRR